MIIHVEIRGSEYVQYRFNNNPTNEWLTDGDGAEFETGSPLEYTYRIVAPAGTLESGSNYIDIYDEDYNLITTQTHNWNIDNTLVTSLSIATGDDYVDLGSGSITEELVSGSIEVNIANLTGDILITGMNDNSFYFSTDNINWFQNRIPAAYLSEDYLNTGGTIDMYIKRIYDVLYGANTSTLTFENNAESFEIDVVSNFVIQEQTASVLFEAGNGTESIQSININQPNNASGESSFAIGNNTEATGLTSYAEGNSTTSTGIGSHAEGSGTDALAQGAHAEGVNTIASATGSHSQGVNTIASGNYSHAGGNNTTASGNFSHSGGNGSGWKVYASGIGAFNHSFVNSSGIIGVEGDYSAILGGYDNNITSAGNYSVILGGSDNEVSGVDSAILSGYNNTNSGNNSAILGGYTNNISGNYSVASGAYTHASGDYSFAGGRGNISYRLKSSGIGSFNYSYQEALTQYDCAGDYSAILGGQNNNIVTGADYSAILGGDINEVSGDYSVILGGVENAISTLGSSSVILGGNNNNISPRYSAILGGIDNTISGAGFSCTILGGYNNNISCITGYNFASIIGSNSCTISDDSGPAIIIAGSYNSIINSSQGSVILGSYRSIIDDGVRSVILSGDYINVSGNYSIAGGSGNSTLDLKCSGTGAFNYSHQHSTTVQYNNAGDYSAILGGQNNNITAAGDQSAILGGATNSVVHTRSVILGGTGITSTADDTVYVPSLEVTASVTYNRKSVSSNTTLDETYHIVLAQFPVSGAYTVTLPDATTCDGREYVIKLVGSTATTVATYLTQTIDGAGSYSLASQYDTITVISDNANWLIISKI